MASITRGNKDYLYGLNMPRQGYALTGAQRSFSGDEVEGKRPTMGPPMFISSQTPGTFMKEDDIWKRTYGASYDAFLTVISGDLVSQASLNMTFLNPEVPNRYQPSKWPVNEFVKIWGSASGTDNMWERINIGTSSYQQIEYLASKDTAEEGSSATEFYGPVHEARGIGLRIPSIVGGWGRTVELLPTDINASNPRYNDDSHKLDRSTWKYGPLDLRWDNRRGVWTGFNDMIADHASGTADETIPNYFEMSTVVHGTNPGGSGEPCGFPFMRGRLDTVWTVRQQPEEAFWGFFGPDPTGFIQRNPFQGRITGQVAAAAEIFTTLNHRVIDGVLQEGISYKIPHEAYVAPLKSAFYIVGEDQKNNCSNYTDLESTCGHETTHNLINDTDSSTNLYGQLGIYLHTPFSPIGGNGGPLDFSEQGHLNSAGRGGVPAGGSAYITGVLDWNPDICKWQVVIAVGAICEVIRNADAGYC